MAAYNGINWIQEQVVSIFNQKKVNFKIYISVDCSTDYTKEFLEKLYSNDSRIIILPYGETFGAAAPNFYRLIRDVDFSEFDYVAFSDQDDIWLPEKLHRATTVMTEGGFDGYSSDVIAFWKNGKRKLLKKSQPQCKYDYLFEGAGPGCTCVMTNKLATALKERVVENWEIANSIDWHDWLAYAFARANNFKWFIDSRPGMLYRQHENNQIGINAGFKAFYKRAKQILSGYGFEQVRKIAHLTGADKEILVQNWLAGNKKSFIFITVNVAKCRRKYKDRIFLILANMILFVFNKTSKEYSSNIHI